MNRERERGREKRERERERERLAIESKEGGQRHNESVCI